EAAEVDADASLEHAVRIGLDAAAHAGPSAERNGRQPLRVAVRKNTYDVVFRPWKRDEVRRIREVTPRRTREVPIRAPIRVRGSAVRRIRQDRRERGGSCETRWAKRNGGQHGPRLGRELRETEKVTEPGFHRRELHRAGSRVFVAPAPEAPFLG